MGATHNAPIIAGEQENAGETIVDDVRRVVRHHGMLLETRVKAAASGRPGPRVITGDYRRSWTTRNTPLAGGAKANVGTNRPQARRLEYGFVGVDSLGRRYNQRPFPHVGPAFEATERGFIADLSDTMDL